MPSVGSSEGYWGTLLPVALAGSMLLIPQGYEVVEVKFMVFTGLADSKTIAMHAAEICDFTKLPSTSCVVPLGTKRVEKSARRMRWQQQAGTASPALQPSALLGTYLPRDESLLAAPGREVNISSSSGPLSPLGW